MEQSLKRTIIVGTVLCVIALFSMFVLSRYASSPEFHEKTIAALDEKAETVMELTAASTAASVAVTFLPGDTATPIADKLADLSTYFLVVLCAVYLEKYLVTITGYAAFRVLIPIACLLWFAGMFRFGRELKKAAWKLVFVSLALVTVIPASVTVSNLIENTYQSSITSVIEEASQAAQEIEESQEETGAEQDEDDGFLSGLVSRVKDGIVEAATGAMDRMEKVLNRFIEALAVMLVTSCVIPILVMLFFVWLIKAALGIRISMPETGRFLGSRTQVMETGTGVSEIGHSIVQETKNP